MCLCVLQEFKYRMLLLRAADCGKNSSTLHQSVAPENEPAHKWTAFCISTSLLHSPINLTYIVVNTANAKRGGERTPCAQTHFYFYSHYYPYPQRQIHNA
jgi:hypothetical protein